MPFTGFSVPCSYYDLGEDGGYYPRADELSRTDMGADMPEVQRKRLAAEAVRKVMKTL